MRPRNIVDFSAKYIVCVFVYLITCFLLLVTTCFYFPFSFTCSLSFPLRIGPLSCHKPCHSLRSRLLVQLQKYFFVKVIQHFYDSYHVRYILAVVDCSVYLI